MGFFAAPPPREPVRRSPQPLVPEWAGPPVNVVPGAVPISVVVGRTADTAVFVRAMSAYPTGLELSVVVVLRPPYQEQRYQEVLDGAASPGLTYGQILPHGGFEDVPFGVKLADGTSAVSYDMSRGLPSGSQAGMGPVLRSHGGWSRDETRIEMRYWLWPLPPSGPLTFVTEFRSRGLAESEVTVDADVVRRAAAQAQVLWPSGPVLPPPGEAPANPDVATVEVVAAFVQAFTGGQADPDAALAAVQDGPALRPAVEQARRNFPEAVTTSRPTVGEVVFLEPTTAAVTFALSYRGGINFGDQIGYAVLVDGRWRVARETYCTVMSWAGADCPPAD